MHAAPNDWAELERELVAIPMPPTSVEMVAPPEIDRNIPIAVHCKGGYRSMIACSLLQRAGFQSVVNVVGGFDAWQQAKLPVATERPVEA